MCRKYLFTSLLIMSCASGDGGRGSVNVTTMAGSSISGLEAEGAREDDGVGSVAVSETFLLFLERSFFTASPRGASRRASWGVDAAMGHDAEVGGVMGTGTNGVLVWTVGAAGAEVDGSTLPGRRR